MFSYSLLASRKMVARIAAKPMISALEKLVPSHMAENTAAERGSVTPSMEARTGPASRMPCMKREKAMTVPQMTTPAKASQPGRGRDTS